VSVVLDFANIAGTPLSFSIPTYEVVVDSEVPPFTVVASIARQNAGMDLDFAEPGTSPLSFALVSYEVMFDGQMTAFDADIGASKVSAGLALDFVNPESSPLSFSRMSSPISLDAVVQVFDTSFQLSQTAALAWGEFDAPVLGFDTDLHQSAAGAYLDAESVVFSTDIQMSIIMGLDAQLGAFELETDWYQIPASSYLDTVLDTFEPNIQVTSLMTLAGPFVSFELDAAFSEPVVFDGYVDSFELDSYIERELPPAVSIDVDSNIPTMVLDASLLDTMVIDVDVTSFDSDIELLSGFYSYIELDSTFVAIGEGSYTGDGWVEPNADIAIQLVYSAVCCDGGSSVIDPYPAPPITGPFNAYVNSPFTEDGLGVDIRMSLYKRAINIPALGDAWLVSSSDGRGHSHSVLGIDRRD
jgi:hypothetical protein